MRNQAFRTVLVLSICVLAFALGASAGRRSDVITAARIHGHMSFLAHDLLEGREAGTRGFDLAATYVAAQLEGMGLDPLPSGNYLQEVPLRRAELVHSGLELRTSEKSVRLETSRDFVVSGHPTLEDYDVDAEVVFVGYGVRAPELGYDDYGGLNVRGKVVAFLDGVPDSLPRPLSGYFQFGTEKWRAAAESGAVSAIRLMTPASTKVVSWDDTVAHVKKGWFGWSDDGSNLFPAWAAVTMSASGVEALLREAGLPWTEALAQVEGHRRSSQSSGLRILLRTKSRPLAVHSRNVAAMLRGTGPHRDQYVVYTAHLDHLGIGRPVDGDAIYNGAVDNASGVAALLCIAEAFVRLGSPPDRSVIFLATTAEEPGLFGSDYFVQRGPIPRREIAALINIDGATLMVHPLRDIVAMGAVESTLGEAARSAARSRGLELRPEGLPLVGSDHFPFAKACVPALWAIAGQKTGRPDIDGAKLEAAWMATRLHSPKDDMAQPLDFQAAADLAAFDFELGRVVANGRNAPTWREETIVRRFLEHRAGVKDCSRK